jgi:serine/threonine protein kinase
VGSIHGVSVIAQASIDGSDSLVGQILDDRYRIDRLIGKGGMGTVYLAEHVMLRRKVAIKTLHPGLSTTTELITRFHQEALAAAAIGNAHVVGVTDMGRLPSGVFYTVLEYLEGADLAWVIASQGALSVARALDLTVQLCEALSAVHAAGIVHRDLKPENLFLVQRGQQADFLKILDFGICKFHDRDPTTPRLTETGVAIGTPHFMAPEQIEASATLDHRADLYAVGAIMFFMLTGRAPFDAASVLGLFNRICRDLPPDLASERGDISPALAAIVTRALAKRPQDRFADAAQLQAALEPLRAGAPLEASGPCKSFAPTLRARARRSSQPTAAGPGETSRSDSTPSATESRAATLQDVIAGSPLRASQQPTDGTAQQPSAAGMGQQPVAAVPDPQPSAAGLVQQPAAAGSHRQPSAAGPGQQPSAADRQSGASPSAPHVTPTDPTPLATSPALAALSDSVGIIPGKIRWTRPTALIATALLIAIAGLIGWGAREPRAQTQTQTQTQRMAANTLEPAGPGRAAPAQERAGERPTGLPAPGSLETLALPAESSGPAAGGRTSPAQLEALQPSAAKAGEPARAASTRSGLAQRQPRRGSKLGTSATALPLTAAIPSEQDARLDTSSTVTAAGERANAAAGLDPVPAPNVVSPRSYQPSARGIIHVFDGTR